MPLPDPSGTVAPALRRDRMYPRGGLIVALEAGGGAHVPRRLAAHRRTSPRRTRAAGRTIPPTGFETRIATATPQRYLAVRALDISGRVTGHLDHREPLSRRRVGRLSAISQLTRRRRSGAGPTLVA